MTDRTPEPSPYPGITDALWNSPRAVTAEALREFAYPRGVARAKWMDHRRYCNTCKAVVPPAGPKACCWKGGKLLDAYLKAIENYNQAKRDWILSAQFTQQALT